MIRFFVTLMALGLLGTTARSAEEAKPNTLTPKEIEEGWILLFDGETTFGWKVEGDSEIKDGRWILGGKKETTLTSTTAFHLGELQFDFRNVGNVKTTLAGQERKLASLAAPPGWTQAVSGFFTSKDGPSRNGGSYYGAYEEGKNEDGQNVARALTKVLLPLNTEPKPISYSIAANAKLILQSVKFRPLGTKPLFNAKDLTGWKVFQDAKRNQSKWTVTPEGWLNVKNGPGDLQTEKTYGDFVLQLECISNGKALNSGVFFRCIANEYQNGYEMQIQNGFKDNDRTKPSDFGTGAIYRRVPARKVIPNDNEWFSMTLTANGNHISTWVNGYQTVDWADDRKADDNPRKGSRTAAGHLSFQGHDPTTDLSFRNIRMVELKSEKK